MSDIRVIEKMGASHDRLRQIFTAAKPSDPEFLKLPEDQRKQLEKDCKTRDAFESRVSKLMSENVGYSLNNYQFYSAVDVAWDAAPINKSTYPLMLYAQGKLDLGSCVKSLNNLPNPERYITRDPATKEPTGINLPRFVDVNFNLVRSVITRRWAAQVNKYAALYPYYKYEPRSTSQVGKLRADVISQIMDIQTDEFDHRHHDAQVIRDMMLYGFSLDFIRASWERQDAILYDRDVAPEMQDPNHPKLKTETQKEGLSFLNPHPSRVFWDNAYPMASINSDTGSEYVGFWDVIRYGDVLNNTTYFNRNAVTWSASQLVFFTTFAQYFTQYYGVIAPTIQQWLNDLSAINDRLNQIGYYAQDQPTAAMVIANIFLKIVPKDWGLGDYPFPTWIRLVVAGYKTIIYAEWLPSTPAAYAGFNQNDNRQLSLGIAHELLSYQDQMSNLTALLLLAVKGNTKVMLVDKDTIPADVIQKFETQVKGQDYYSDTFVLAFSRAKATEMGLNLEHIVQLVETQNPQNITVIFQAMTTLVAMAERLMALSPHELGQPAPHELSATETNMMAGTTETIYGSISNAIDEFRAAKKRILYESYMMCGNQNFRVPVMNRYSKKVIEQAGFKIVEEEEDLGRGEPDELEYHTVIGTKGALFYNYIFTSRDGALRSVNTQSANVLVQLMAVLQNPIIAQAVGKEKLYEIVNEIFRLSGAGVDLKLELKEGEKDAIGVDMNQQVQQILQQLTQEVQQNAQGLQKVGAEVQQLVETIKQLTAEVQRIDQESQKQPANPMVVDPIKIFQARQSDRRAEEQHRQRMQLERDQQGVDAAVKTFTAANDAEVKRHRVWQQSQTTT